MNKIFQFILITLLLIGCNDQITSPDVGAPNSYFPLSKGNVWSFNSVGSDSIYSTARIVDQIIIDNKEYFLLSFIEDLTQADTINIENNIIYRNLNKTRTRWLDFNKKDGQSYNIGEMIVSVETGINVSTNLGEYNNCVCFRFDDPRMIDEEVNYYFSKGVGIVKIESAWVILTLLEYELK